VPNNSLSNRYLSRTSIVKYEEGTILLYETDITDNSYGIYLAYSSNDTVDKNTLLYACMLQKVSHCPGVMVALP
jgi:parallel beta-helix repeat protein